MVGDHDDAITIDEAQTIKESYKNSESQLIVFEGAGHDLSIEKFKSRYIESIKTFLSIIMK
jgi:esterase/lipase